MNKTKASCPASLSFIFKACPNDNPLKMGSIGVGCTLDQEIIVEAEKAARDEIIFNGTLINFPTVHTVIKSLADCPVRISIISSLPLGYGFGISSASSLSTAYALNRLFKLKKNKLELAKIAHLAEIKNLTGLGSVATQITGGFLVKNKPGIPALRRGRPALPEGQRGRPVGFYRLPFVGKKLYAVIIDRLETPTVLHDKRRLKIINEFADEALSKIKTPQNITLEEVIDISYSCAKKSGLLQNREENKIIDIVRSSGGHATMSMLGYVVLSTIKLDKMTDYPVKELVISEKTVKYL